MDHHRHNAVIRLEFRDSRELVICGDGEVYIHELHDWDTCQGRIILAELEKAEDMEISVGLPDETPDDSLIKFIEGRRKQRRREKKNNL